MLGARVTCLMFFARVFHWWVCGVAGDPRVTIKVFLLSLLLSQINLLL